MSWLPPDEVLPRALSVLLQHASGKSRVCLIRDNRGRIRVAIGVDAVGDPQRLEADLGARLGRWYAGPLVDSKGSPAHRRIAQEMLRDVPVWPADWPAEVEGPDGRMQPRPDWLVGRAILQSKESWLSVPQLQAPSGPRVVSFYSFKGGVGRTTTLGCVAARLASQRKKKVVAIDLDLEAPGTGTFLGAREPIGVIDHLLSHLATGDCGDVHAEPVDGVPGLYVLPAGLVGPGYVEKLARMDFLASQQHGQAPAETALRALLEAIADSLNPDIILLDSRAGLHDIGGLALHRLSHADMLVARANVQARDGMHLVLRAIRRLRAPGDRDVHLIQTMVPLPFDSDVARPTIAQWKRQMYDTCLDTIYEDLEEDQVPQLEQEAAHYPLLVGERPEFTRTDRLDQVAPELLIHFDRIADIVAPAPEEEDEDVG